jgi:hypothetical protein
MNSPDIRTEDGAILHEGDRAYDYYSMEPGTIGKLDDLQKGWFDFYHDNGRRIFLNGQRICTMEFARRRGFPRVPTT